MDEHDEGVGAVGPAAGQVEPVGSGPDMRVLARELVASATERGIALTGEGGLLTALTRQVLQSALEAELSEHLGYDKHDPMGRNLGNSRNGTTRKTVHTEIGEVTIDVPRYRAGPSSPSRCPSISGVWKASTRT
jgi:hypothetical protein